MKALVLDHLLHALAALAEALATSLLLMAAGAAGLTHLKAMVSIMFGFLNQ